MDRHLATPPHGKSHSIICAICPSLPFCSLYDLWCYRFLLLWGLTYPRPRALLMRLSPDPRLHCLNVTRLFCILLQVSLFSLLPVSQWCSLHSLLHVVAAQLHSLVRVSLVSTVENYRNIFWGSDTPWSPKCLRARRIRAVLKERGHQVPRVSATESGCMAVAVCLGNKPTPLRWSSVCRYLDHNDASER